MAVKVVIFDLDGTLLDSAPDICFAVNKSLAQLQLPFSVSLQQTQNMIGGGVTILLKRTLDLFQYSYDALLLQRLYRYFLQHYQAHNCQQSKLYPGAMQALQQLRDSGYKVALCTNKPYQPTLAILRHFAIESLFAACLGGDSLAEKKPSPLPLLTIAEQLGCQPRQCAYVGDSEVDYLAAQAADMPFIFIPFGYNQGFTPATCLSCHELSQLPAIIASLPPRETAA